MADETKKEKKKKKNSDDTKLWLILGEEELPLGISVAKTEGGAKRIYSERTGRSRDCIHVEEIKFHKQYAGFTSLT
jgi:hypothetical protein